MAIGFSDKVDGVFVDEVGVGVVLADGGQDVPPEHC